MENLDAMDVEELHAFVRSIGSGVRPNMFKGHKHGIKATLALRAYAWNIITARSCREVGQIQTALMYEAIAEKCYQSLPDYARW